MSVNPGAVGRPADPGSGGAAGPPAIHTLRPEEIARLAHAYLATYRGPHDAPAADSSVTLPVDMSSRQMIGPALVTSHHRLGRNRPVGETRVAVYGSDDPAGFGPALQIVTDFTPMVMDSVTVLLHRFGVSYTAIMNPVFRVRRSPDGELLDVRPREDVGASREGIDESWIHVQLGQSADSRALTRGRAGTAQRPVRRATGGLGLRCDGGDDARTGARTRHRPRRPIPRT